MQRRTARQARRHVLRHRRILRRGGGIQEGLLPDQKHRARQARRTRLEDGRMLPPHRLQRQSRRRLSERPALPLSRLYGLSASGPAATPSGRLQERRKKLSGLRRARPALAVGAQRHTGLQTRSAVEGAPHTLHHTETARALLAPPGLLSRSGRRLVGPALSDLLASAGHRQRSERHHGHEVHRHLHLAQGRQRQVVAARAGRRRRQHRV